MAASTRFPVKLSRDRVLLIERERIFYLRAKRHDTVVRLAGRKMLRHIEPLEEVEARLPTPPFFRCHRSFIVNLDRVRELRIAPSGDHELRMDPPVNAVIPVSRKLYPKLRKLFAL